MEITTFDTPSNAKKSCKLIATGMQLGMDLSGYGEMGLNIDSGNVYMWLEDYRFTLFIPKYESAVYACFFDTETGNEFTTALDDMSLAQLEEIGQSIEEELNKSD